MTLANETKDPGEAVGVGVAAATSPEIPLRLGPFPPIQRHQRGLPRKAGTEAFYQVPGLTVF